MTALPEIAAAAACRSGRVAHRDAASRARATHTLTAAALLAAAALALSFTSACGARQTSEASYTEAAELAFMNAERAFDRKDYELARQRYGGVSQQYPYSMYAALAEFRTGDAYLREKSFARAIDTFRRFVRMRPTHERVAEAQYKIALAYVQQMPRDLFIRPPSYERDLTDAENAHRALESFVAGYADSPFADDARDHLARTTERLSAYERYAAEYYARRGNPRGAAMRCDALLQRFPESPYVPDALFLYARAMIELGDVDEAVQSLERLVAAHPDHERAVDARGWLATHQAAR